MTSHLKAPPSPLRGEVRRRRGEGPLCALLALALTACTQSPPAPTPKAPAKATSPKRLPTPELRAPSGLDLDRTGALYLADADRIRKLPPAGAPTTLTADLDTPLGVAIRRDGTLLVADTRHHRIRAIAPDGTATTLAGTGTAGAADGQFNTPTGLALDALDAVLVADTANHRIRRIDRAGKVTTLAGAGPGLVDGDLAKARFTAPADLAVDARGRIYVADTGSHAIRVIDEAAGTVRTLAGAGQPGDADGEAGAARFNYPSGLAVDATGAVYVADSQNQAVRKVYPDGRVVTLARGSGGAFVPTDVAVTGDGKVYVSDSANRAVFTLD